MTRINIKNLSLTDLAHCLKEMGIEKYRLQQVVRWLYSEDVADFSEMTNLSKALRQELGEKFAIERLPLQTEQASEDGTRKYLLQLPDAQTIESVLIPSENRLTLCVSSQVGCAMACRYCLTGRLGLKRNLTQFELLEQVLAVQRSLPEERKITNLVFMGMGEPMQNLEALLPALEILLHDLGLNFSKNKITVSTSGLVPEMLEFGSKSEVKLAISLSATTNELRDLLVPVNKRYPLEALLEACRQYPLKRRGRITFEYVVLEGVNDSLEDAKRMARLLADIPSKINLIPFNEFPGSEFKRPSDAKLRELQDYLLKRGFQTNIRASRGRDILGACGQLKAAYEPRKRLPLQWPAAKQSASKTEELPLTSH